MAASTLESAVAGIALSGAPVLAGRALLGWMTREEAVRFLMEDCLFSTPLTPRAAEELWESHKARIDNLLLREEPLNPRKAALSATDLKAARQFRSRHPEAEAVIDFAVLDPMDLVIHQLWISTSIADDYRDRVTADKWLNTALLDPPTRSRLKWRRAGNAFLVDLPHFEYFLAGPWKPDGQMWVSEADPFVTVALHADRGLLLKGYHRTFACAQSLASAAVNGSRGVLFGVSNALAMMGSDANDILRMMEGRRPPRMGDLFDERMFVPVTLRRRQYQMRIDYEVAEIAQEELQTAEAPIPYAAALEQAQASRRAPGDEKKSAPLRSVQAMFEVAMRYQHAGRLDRAIPLYERVISLKPDFSDAHNNLGVALMSLRRLSEAIPHYERALALSPDDADFHSNIGVALAESGRIPEAIPHYERALALKPGLVATRTNLGLALLTQARLSEALEQAERSFADQPDNADVLSHLSLVLSQVGRVDEAKVYGERALSIDPRHAQAHTNMANIYKIQGQFDEAVTHFRQAIEIKPDMVEAYGNLAEIKTFRPGDPDLSALEALAGRKDLPGNIEMVAHFALAKALEDCRDYSRSFEQLRQGNALKHGQINYKREAADDMFRRIAAAFDSNLLDRFRGAGDPSSVPIFVLGMPRSGSTLVEQILGSHPQVYAAGELTDLAQAERTELRAAGLTSVFPEYISDMNRDHLRRLGRAYLDRLPALADGQTRVVDKLPSNMLKIGLIRMILPNAKIIHTMRDPVDTCVSCYSRLFNYGGPAYSYDLTDLGQYYRLYSELMAYWRAILPPGALLDVVYEEVVDDIEGQARRLIEYCGLPWDARCLDFHKTKRDVRTASSAQVRKPLYRSSVQRWRKYEADIGPLLDALGDLVPGAAPFDAGLPIN